MRAWDAKVGAFVDVFFVPICFTVTGLRTDIGSPGSGKGVEQGAVPPAATLSGSAS